MRCARETWQWRWIFRDFRAGKLGGPCRGRSRRPLMQLGRQLPRSPRTASVAAVAPGVAPWVSARFGLPASNEAGLAYTGRGFRLDARHVFNRNRVAFSIGAGATWLLPVPLNRPIPRRAPLPRRAFGDSTSPSWWVGEARRASFRCGAARAAATSTYRATYPATPPGFGGSLSANRWYAGGLVGLGLGFRHLHGNLELDASYQDVRGTAMGFRARRGSR